MAAAGAGAARGPPNWEPAWSSAHQRWFYQDRKNGASSWTRPSGCTVELPRSPPADASREAASALEDLPPGWEAEWDPKHKMYYYFNRTTRERVWKKPPGTSRPAAGAGAGATPGERAGASSAASSSAGPGGAAGVQGRFLDPPAPMPNAMVRNLTPDSMPTSPTDLANRRRAPATGDGWDAAAFLDRLARAKATGVQDAVKAVRKEVAEHNYEIRHRWRVPRTVYVSAESCLQGRQPGFHPEEPVVTFSEGTTADAVQLLAFGPTKPKICALNFANGVKVGGGYKNGALAQEEDLCRRMPALYSSLFNAKRDGYYPFGPSTCSSPSRPEKYSDVLWTPEVAVARTGEAEGFALLPSEQQALASTVAAAAPNINFARPKDIKDVTLMYNTVKNIFICPRIMQPDVSVLILGAWGCGAFGCDPREVSELFARALARDGLGKLYREVHFAIPKSGPDDIQADTFREALRRHGIGFRELSMPR